VGELCDRGALSDGAQGAERILGVPIGGIKRGSKEEEAPRRVKCFPFRVRIMPSGGAYGKVRFVGIGEISLYKLHNVDLTPRPSWVPIGLENH
jgi:hypothetical protein